MNERTKPVSEEELQAYVDGQLEGPRHDRVAAIIASDPELARRANELRGLGEAMHAAYDSALDEPVPPQMLQTVMDRGPAPLLRLAAAVAWMTVGGVIGGVIVSQTGPERTNDVATVRPLPREAAYAHAVYVPEVRHPVEVGADERAHLNAWLSKRLAHPVAAPDVRRIGYQLVGGRLLPDAGRPAAQFMYEDAHGVRVTLYVRAHGGRARETALRHAENGGVGVVYWVDGPLAYALAGSIEKTELEHTAEAMYRALNP
jgi:anti-sigma factor RsiW